MASEPTCAELKERLCKIEEELDKVRRERDSLREVEKRYGILLDESVDPIFSFTPDGRYVYVNRAFADGVGRSLDQIIGKRVWDVFPKEEADKRFAALKQVFQTGEGKVIEVCVPRPGGDRFYITTITPIKNEQGQVVTAICSSKNITERKKMEDALRESLSTTQSIFRAAPVGIGMVIDRVIMQANDTLCVMTGYSREELIGKSARMLYPNQEEFERVGKEKYEEIHLRGMGAVETRWRRKGGEEIDILLSSSPIDLSDLSLGVTFTALDITQRKLSEEALRGSETLFRNLFEHHSAVKLIVDPDTGGIIDANTAAAEFYGWTREQLRGLKVWDINTLGPEAVKQAMEKARGRERVHFEFRHRRADGSIREVDVYSSRIEAKGKALLHSIVHDVTERKRIEEKVKDTLSLLEATLESTADGILVADGKGKMVLFNKKFAAMWRLPPEIAASGDDEAALGFVLGQLRDPDLFLIKVRELYGSPEKSSFDVLEFKDSRVFERYSQPQRIGDLVIGRVWSFRDVTERKRAEQTLMEGEERYRNILESIEEGYYEVDLSGKFTFFNDSVCRLLGYSREELMGMNDRQYTDARSARELFQAFNEVYRTGKPTKGFDWEVIRKDGAPRYVEASVSLMKDAEGKPMGFRGIARDITSRRQAEEEKQRLEAQLQQAQKMEAIGTLAGGIAHDFNNLLMGIQGRASLMLADMIPSHPHFEHLRGIEEYVRSAADLTRQLLGFARGGKYEVKTADMNELTDRSATLFGRTKKEITIHRKFQSNLWTVEVDRRQIEQVLLNLFVNAWQAMPAGGELYLQTQDVVLDDAYANPHNVNPGRYVKISVTDTGLGMDEHTKQRLFDPFFTTKGMGRGTGLGLASAYGIIRNHDGFITVYSEKGHGSTFNLYLPASGKGVTEEAAAPADLVMGEGTILLVDDEEMILEVGQPLLEKLGYRVLEARSGKAALALYQENMDRIRAVILDMVMPQMSGGETFDRLKALDPGVKVLLASGYSINGQAQEIITRGCQGFIQKPFNLRELSRRLGEILGRP